MPKRLLNDLDPLLEPPNWARDVAAQDEEENWSNEPAIRGQKVTNKVMWLKVYGPIISLFTVVFALLFVLSLGAWAAHYILPVSCHWLTAEQLEKIQSVLFSGGMGAVLSGIAQKQLTSA